MPVQGKDLHTTQLFPIDQAVPIAHGMPGRCLMVAKLVAMLASWKPFPLGLGMLQEAVFPSPGVSPRYQL